MRILGIDPGTVVTGFGIVDEVRNKLVHVENGALYAGKNDPLQNRLRSIHCGLSEIINKFNPGAIVMEEVFLAQNVRTALHLGHARGIVMLSIAEHSLPHFEYSTKTIKKAVVGYGNASKEQVQLMIKQLLKLPDVAMTDASDALAAAICHIHSSKIEKQLPSDKKRRRIFRT